MVSHFPSKNPAKRRSALRTSTEISCPSPGACLRRPPLLARCPLTLHLWRRANRNPATLPDDSASVPALQSIDRLLCSSQSMTQLLSRCSLVVLLLSQGFKAAHF